MNHLNAADAVSYMYHHASDHVEGGDINLTSLAEACAAHFDADEIGGPLDDPDHEIWEWAMDAARRAGFSV